MKKGLLIGGVVVAVLIVGGVYVMMHNLSKSNKPVTSSHASASAAAVNNAIVVTKTSSSLGQYLAEPDGTPLYTYGGDTSGMSNCTGSCLASWPAYQDKGATSGLPTGFSTITRTDNGDTQYTYKGMPLYTFLGDTGGQVTGNNISNFTVAKPGTTTTSAASTPTTASTTASSSSSSDSSSNW